ncbi:dipeptide ABC transporter ATP-binding protein [Bordetella genomosp. 4]|uniref:Multidrug ABC transporter ATP-binding protein n=1 Tax=Bordetella genomosp. 4 TaxID=463044 RepID=A0A261U3G2_9BORD|nr:ABC transporter ATP-binding protein [Bordetella genomosp. 4]OZI56017.1 multidrug ABC transporter ATP-binding protein [Bordetella genomosp. 4]
MSLLQLSHLTLTVDVALDDAGNTAPAEVLRDITLSVPEGQMLGLVGESGAGKSMIGRMVAGTIPAGFRISQGSLTFKGQDLNQIRPAQRRQLLGRQIAFIPQEPLSGLNPALTVRQQLFEHLRHVGIPAAQWETYASSRLAEVGLTDTQAMLSRYPHQMSGGQCQRILIAMAFCGDPALIFADEPTTALDVITQAQIMQVLAEQQRRHKTAVVLVTHDLRLAAHVCDAIAVLYAGEVVELGSARQVLDAPLHPYTRSLKESAPGMGKATRLLQALPDFMPGLKDFARLQGCRFASRCPIRQESCAMHHPDLSSRDGERAARCLDHIPAWPVNEADGTDALAALRNGPPAGSRSPVVQLRDVALSYPGPARLFRSSRSIQILEPLNVHVEQGEFLGIVGESGSGKTSLARLMAGMVAPTAGQIEYPGSASGNRRLGASIPLADPRDVQLVFQNPDSALNPRRRVGSLVTQILEVSRQARLRTGAASHDRNQIAQQLLASVGLPPEAADRLPSQLSGGQKQRVNIARALCVTPRMIVADEIVSGLDVSVQALILNLLLQLKQELGIALVFVSHDLAVVRYLCTRVLVLHKGRIVEQGPTDQVFEQPSHPYTRALIAAVPPDSAAEAWRPAVQDAGGALHATPAVQRAAA